MGLRYIKGYLVHKAHISPAVELKEAYMAKFGVWQIMILWQLGPQTVCTSHIRSVGPRVFYSYSLYTRLTVESNRVYGLVWDAVVPTVGGVPVADYDFMAVWNAVVPTNEGVPMADYDFMAVWTMYCIYQQY